MSPPDTLDWSASILVVDDEPLITRVLDRMLTNCDVTVVHGGEQALEVIADAGDTFDVVLCDLSMPGMSGSDLYAQVQESHPTLCSRFVFMTGGTFEPKTHRFLQSTECPAILKPFKREDVLSAIRRAAEVSQGSC